MKGVIHSFETFGTVDGPGIRFVVFFKGCPLRCLYCHNPDTWTTSGSKLLSVDEIVSNINKYRNYYQNGGVTISVFTLVIFNVPTYAFSRALYSL